MSDSFDLMSLTPAPRTTGDAYRRNFLKAVICELRFPVIDTLHSTLPPASMAKALRKAFPTHESGTEMTVTPKGVESDPIPVHHFAALRGFWRASIKPSSIVIETRSYTRYEKLRERVSEVAEAARQVIESDFFTRVGLRYTNVVPVEGLNMHEWINSALSGPLVGHGFNGVAEYGGRIHLRGEGGGVLLQHGVNTSGPNKGSGSAPDYVIDTDVYREGIEFDALKTKLDEMHKQGFGLFEWALGPKAIQYLEHDSSNSSGDKS